MGLILDTSILIAEERRGHRVRDVVDKAREIHGVVEVAISAICSVELTHGIYRAKTEAQMPVALPMM